MRQEIIYINPVAKPRMTRADKWLKRSCVVRYWEYKDDLQKKMPKDFKNPGVIGMFFSIPMPASWPKKKRSEMWQTPHKNKPDIDNLLKGVLDALYKKDEVVHYITRAGKIWYEIGKIEIEWEDERSTVNTDDNGHNC